MHKRFIKKAAAEVRLSTKDFHNKLFKDLKLIKRQLQTIVDMSAFNSEIGLEIMSQLDDAMVEIEAAAEADTSADNAAKTMLVKLSDMLKAALAGGGDTAAVTGRIRAIADGIKSRAASLSEAVVANTPAEEGGGSTGGVGGSTGGVKS